MLVIRFVVDVVGMWVVRNIMRSFIRRLMVSTELGIKLARKVLMLIIRLMVDVVSMRVVRGIMRGIVRWLMVLTELGVELAGEILVLVSGFMVDIVSMRVMGMRILTISLFLVYLLGTVMSVKLVSKILMLVAIILVLLFVTMRKGVWVMMITFIGSWRSTIITLIEFGWGKLILETRSET